MFKNNDNFFKTFAQGGELSWDLVSLLEKNIIHIYQIVILIN